MCKLKLDYVVALQSNLMKNHTPVEPTEIIIKETKKEKLKRKIDEIIDDSMTVNTQSKRRRLIDIKGIEEEPVVEREKTEFDCQYCDRGFNEYDALNHHMNTAHNLNEVQCRKCNDWYKIKIIDENKKITIYEKKIKEYVCDYCVNSKILINLCH